MFNKTPRTSPAPIASDLSSNSPSPAHPNALPLQNLRTIRPFGAYALQGLASWNTQLLSIDMVRGYLLQIDPKTDNTTVLNPHHTEHFRNATGLALHQNSLWFIRDELIYEYPLKPEGDGAGNPIASNPIASNPIGDNQTGAASMPVTPPELRLELPDRADGLAICGTTLYVSCQQQGCIWVFNGQTGQLITRFFAPGVGDAYLTVQGEELWVCDRLEQTVYCLDRATGDVQFSILTPFAHPTGLAFYTHPETNQECLYVAYAGEEPYVRDDPNASRNPFELAFRDRTFIHPLHFVHHPDQHYTLSNGYLMELSYVEELSPLDAVHLESVEWRIALPSDTLRQKVLHIEAVGLPFTEEEQDGERVAVFKFDALHPHEGRLFGWKALLEVRGIKYHLTPPDLPNHATLPPDFETRYLVDNDNLAMNSPTIRRAAQEVTGGETNILRKVLCIRDGVYDRLSYGIKPRIDTPDVVWERRVGSCGEYVGVLLALLRLNGIACRTVGRYKCPTHAGDQYGVPLQPDYNHVWLEFYVPGLGWLPMESNPDDLTERGPYPMRFFMGLAWYHAEIGRGLPFERVLVGGQALKERFPELSLGDLAINHVRFVILQELPPPVGKS